MRPDQNTGAGTPELFGPIERYLHRRKGHIQKLYDVSAGFSTSIGPVVRCECGYIWVTGYWSRWQRRALDSEGGR